MNYFVIDNQTNEQANIEKIVLNESWADLDADNFAMREDGTLVLLGEEGCYCECPKDRFKIIFREENP